jgi:hypothetical protein
VFASFLPVWRAGWNVGPQELRSDPIQYFRMTRNLVAHGTFSREYVASGSPSPQAYREPGFPVFLAPVFLVNPDLVLTPEGDLFSSPDDDTLVPKNEGGRRLVLLLHRWRLVLLPVTIVLTGTLARAVGAGWPAAVAASVCLGLSDRLLSQSDTLYSENLAMPLLIASGLALRGALSGGWKLAAVAGVVGALLVLTKAAYLYLLMCFPLLLVGAGLAGKSVRRMSRAALVCGLASAVVLAPWLIRNWMEFGRVFVAERGGLVMSYRAEYNGMNWTEYRAAFLYLIPAPTPREWLNRWLPPESYARLDRSNPTGFYETARTKRSALIEEFGSTSRADEAMLEDAMARIKAHPFRHLFATLPLGWGGTFVENGIWPLNTRNAPDLPFLLNPILFAAFAWIVARAIARRDAASLLALAPFAYSFLFHSLATNSIPRFNEMILPVLWVSAVVMTASVCRGAVRLISPRRASV